MTLEGFQWDDTQLWTTELGSELATSLPTSLTSQTDHPSPPSLSGDYTLTDLPSRVGPRLCVRI